MMPIFQAAPPHATMIIREAFARALAVIGQGRRQPEPLSLLLQCKPPLLLRERQRSADAAAAATAVSLRRRHAAAFLAIVAAA